MSNKEIEFKTIQITLDSLCHALIWGLDENNMSTDVGKYMIGANKLKCLMEDDLKQDILETLENRIRKYEDEDDDVRIKHLCDIVDVCLEIWTREFSWNHVGLVAILIQKIIMHAVTSHTIKHTYTNFLKTLKKELHVRMTSCL